MLKPIGFDGDNTLWHSENYYREASALFIAILGHYVDVGDARVRAAMRATEQCHLKLFGYGARGMTLSMVETAIAITDGQISVADVHRPVEVGKDVLQHPVELLPGVRDGVTAVAEHHAIVLITKERFVPPGKESGAVGVGRFVSPYRDGLGKICPDLSAITRRVRVATSGVCDGRQLAAFGYRAGIRLGGRPCACRTT